MLDQLLLLPGWALAIAAGAVTGAIGVALSLWLRRFRPGVARYLPLVFFALGYAAADRYLIPDLMRSDAAHCAIATETARLTTEQRAGTQPDPVTSFTGTAADCTARTLTTTYTTALRTDIDPAGLANVEAAFTADTCGDPGLRRMIEGGWVVENVYEFRSGAPLVMTAVC